MFDPAGGTVAVSIFKLKVRVCIGPLDMLTACKNVNRILNYSYFLFIFFWFQLLCGET